MVKFTTVDTHDGFYPSTRFDCPHCGCYTSFYSVSPVDCRICFQPIGFDARKLIINFGSERQKYHVSDKQN